MTTLLPPKVSVIVFVFNHANYIENTLNTINAQDLDGGVEIILHDDASTDNSEATYRRIAATSRYPIKIIRPAENRYSKEISMWPDVLAACSGDYIAICEGDDFWLSSGKLAYQCSALDQLPHVDLAFHKVARAHWQTEQINGYYADYGDEPRLFAPADVIVGDGGFMPTPSLLFRRAVFERLPDWFFTRPPVEDYFIQVFGALRGGALYLPLCAAAYREGDPTSWSQRVTANPDIASKFELGFIDYLFRLRNSIPADFAPNVDTIMLNHYLKLCHHSFVFRKMDNLEKVARLIADNS